MQTNSGTPGNVQEGLEGFWGGFIIGIAICILIFLVFLCAYLYNKKHKQKSQNNRETNIHKEEFELLEKYRKLNDDDKAKITKILSQNDPTNPPQDGN